MVIMTSWTPLKQTRYYWLSAKTFWISGSVPRMCSKTPQTIFSRVKKAYLPHSRFRQKYGYYDAMTLLEAIKNHHDFWSQHPEKMWQNVSCDHDIAPLHLEMVVDLLKLSKIFICVWHLKKSIDQFRNKPIFWYSYHKCLNYN